MQCGTNKLSSGLRGVLATVLIGVVLGVCVVILPIQGQLYATTFLKVTSDTSIPVAPNGLGNVIPDTLINLLDLVRLRDIANGINGAPTAYELVQGDLDLDGFVDGVDLDILGRVLLQEQGPPQFLDATTGGQIVSENVAMTFSPRDMGLSSVMSLEKKSPDQLQAQTGVDFQELTADSTYYITGWQLDASRSDFVYPPSMEIAIDEMPPCELEGANLLMSARRGPLGTTELVMLTELEVAADSTLLSPPPPYPTIGVPSELQYEPLQHMRIPANNISVRKIGNAVLFTQDGENWISNTAAWFEPLGFVDYSEVEDIVVAVPDLPPGPTTVKLLHLGTGLESESQTIEILPLHTPTGPAEVELTAAFAAIDTFLTAFPDFLIFQSYPFTENSSWREEISLLRPNFTAVRDSLLNNPIDIQNIFLAWIENLDLVARIDTAMTYFDKDGRTEGFAILRAARTVLSFGTFGRDGESGTSAQSGFSSAKSHYGGVGDSPNGSCQLPGESSDGTDIGDLEAEIKFNSDDHRYKRIMPGRFWSRAQSPLSTDLPPALKSSDPSFDPEEHPGFCMNIWHHKTNAAGGADGGDDCGGAGKRLPPLSGELKSVIPADYQTLVGGFVSPLKGAIVTPINGGIPGIVGVVDGAGSFAIPGLRPGEEIHFSIYDPNTGLFDPDAGHATAPNIAEHGVWFSAHLHFEPETTLRIRSLDLGEPIEELINFDQQRVEFILSRDYRDPGAISLGFCADVPMKFEITAPDGEKIVDLHEDTSFLDLSLLFDQEGEYSVVVAYSPLLADGSFVLQAWDRDFYPLPQISCVAWGALHDSRSPYSVVGDALVPLGEELVATPGQVIEFETNSSLRVDGEFNGTGSVEAPLILRPYVTSVVFK